MRALSPLPGTAQRCRLGEPFSSPSPIVLVTMLHFSRITVRDALPKPVAFLELTARLCNFVKFLSIDCGECTTVLAFAGPNIWKTVCIRFRKLFVNPVSSTVYFPSFCVRCFRCQEQGSDTG